MRRSPDRLRRPLERPVDGAARRVERRVVGERDLVQPAAEAVLHGHSQLGLPAAPRLEVRRVDDVRRQARVGVLLEEVELARERELDLAGERDPVPGRIAVRRLEDLVEGRHRHVPSEVHPREPETPRDRDVLRRKIGEERLASVG